MHVAAIHRVSDPEGFTKAEDEAIAAGLPDGFSLPIHAATHDHGVGICIWEGPSVEAVRELVELYGKWSTLAALAVLAWAPRLTYVIEPRNSVRRRTRRCRLGH